MAATISRAFTTRRTNKITTDVPLPMPRRSLTTKHSDTIRQQKISHPIELVSTTNMLSYSAPDIYPRSRSSSNSSVESMTSGSSASDGSPSSVTTPVTSPEPSSSESSPIAKVSDLNNISVFFPPSPDVVDAPVIPSRAPSHTKKHSEVMARQRSLSRAATKGSISSQKPSSANSVHAPPTLGRVNTQKSSISTTRSSVDMFSPQSEYGHPFGNELAQVSELAEEFGSSTEKPAVDPEEQELISLGLRKFAAADYMSEIQGLFITAFGALPVQPTTLWI